MVAQEPNLVRGKNTVQQLERNELYCVSYVSKMDLSTEY